MRLFRFFQKRQQMPVDSWDFGATSYVSWIRPEIEGLAQQISPEIVPLQSRYNPEFRCAEIFFNCGLVLLRVNVHGNHGVPYEVIVTYGFEPNFDQKTLIKRQLLSSAQLPTKIEFHFVQAT